MNQSALWGATDAAVGRGPECLTAWRPQDWSVTEDWRALVNEFFACEAGQQLGEFVRNRLGAGCVVYPPQPLRALELTPLADVRVVILGQDPYHGPRQAEGLAFSVAPGEKTPPSLRNIFKELQRDLGLAPAVSGSLVRWARQGVLLLNTSLTVEDGQPASHARRGWQVLTDTIIQVVAQSGRPVVFMLWGAHAQGKRAQIDASPHRTQHLILAANHPSPLSAVRPPVPFLGCGHFGRANQFLVAQGLKPVCW